MFKEYQSKPVVRLAYQIKPTDNVVQCGYAGDYKVLISDKWELFRTHQVVESGDWVVYLNENDVYHCSDQVFRERNVVP